jgi:hypothetical protein
MDGKVVTDSLLYHEGNRRLQDDFDSRRIADRLEHKLARVAFTESDRAFIESAIYFFSPQLMQLDGRIAPSRAARQRSCTSSASTNLLSPITTATGCSKA